MTNKKFKVAAMSMALTACVAAQPLIANAADDVNAVSNEPTGSAPQSEEGSSVSAPVAVASEGSSNTEVKAEEKQDMLAPDEHLGEYSEPKTDTDGNSTSKADITKDAPEQEREPEIDGDGGAGLRAEKFVAALLRQKFLLREGDAVFDDLVPDARRVLCVG